MYYQDPKIIEQEDIESVESCGLEIVEGEPPRLHVIMRLRPDRTYIPEKGLLLYLTDGVHHRLLAPEQYVDVAPTASVAAKKKQFQPAVALAAIEELQQELKQEVADGSNS